jgi:hypothetical protein
MRVPAQQGKLKKLSLTFKNMKCRRSSWPKGGDESLFGRTASARRRPIVSIVEKHREFYRM